MKLKRYMYTSASLLLLLSFTDCGTYGPVLAVPRELKTQVPAIPVLAVLPARQVSLKDATKSLNYQKKGDLAMGLLMNARDSISEFKLADMVISDYKEALILDSKSVELMHKYCKAIALKYNFLIPDGEREPEKKKAYAETLEMLETLYPGDNNTIYTNYDKALFLILNGQYNSIFQVIGVVNRIRLLCESIYKEDPGFEDYSALSALGRINYLAPNIPVFITWPDKKLSERYLEEALKNSPDSFRAKFFLADTLLALGEKEKAEGCFRDIMCAAPREDMNYFEDRKVQSNCGTRMKELGIK